MAQSGKRRNLIPWVLIGVPVVIATVAVALLLIPSGSKQAAGQTGKPLAVAWHKTFGGDTGNSIVVLPDGGFAVAGGTKLKDVLYEDVWVLRLDSTGKIVWDKTFGETKADSVSRANSIVALADGGFAVAGFTSSKGAGHHDVWVLRLDGAGKILWDKTFGGPKADGANSIVALSDGGFAVAGWSASKGAGFQDAWVLRLDSTGRILWDKTYSGPKYTHAGANSIVATPDGGFAVAGSTQSNGAGGHDAWVLRLDSKGRRLWVKIFGGPNADRASSIVTLPDGGFAVAGTTSSKGSGNKDARVLRLDSAGKILWDKTFGGSKRDGASSIVALPDGGFAVAGFTSSKGAAKEDAWILRLDSIGRMLWDKSIGGPGSDVALSIVALTDGGFAATGWTMPPKIGLRLQPWVLRIGHLSAK